MSGLRTDRPPRRPVPSAWKVGLGLVAAILLVAGVGVLIARAAGFGEVRRAVARADTSWLVVCFVAQVAALGGYAGVVREAFRWRGGREPGLRLSTHVMLAGLGATRVFAAGGAGALAATYWCFQRAGFAGRDALVRVLGLNTLFYVPYGVGAFAAALVLALGIWGEAPFAFTLPWLVVIPFCFLAAAFVTQPARVGRLTRSEGWLGRRALGYGIAGTAWVREVLREATGRRSLTAAGFYWVGNVVCLWAALRSVGEPLPVPEIALAFATGHAATVLPLPLGGVGGVDAAMTYALTVVGVPLAPALVAVAVFRLFAFWAPTIPAVVALALLPRAGRALERAAPATA